MKFFVTGGAGFIGSTFCDQALERGYEVLAYDDLSTGRELFIKDAQKNPRFRLVKGDIRDLSQLGNVLNEYKPDWVIHLAANADVRRGLDRPRRDLDYNTTGTWNVLESARLAGCRRILFSSTGSVYGEPEVFPTPENAPFPEQTSLYAASKLAGEALISAYCHGYDFTGLVFRFVSILGPRYTHGHVFDFSKKLREDPSRLEVLGNGKQFKSYLHIHDLMRGLWLAIDQANSGNLRGFQVHNIGHDDALTVDQSIGIITKTLGLHPTLAYTGGTRGWVGDSPRIQLDTTKLKKLGWKAQLTLEQGVTDTVNYLREHPGLLNHS